MADPADFASEQEERDRQIALYILNCKKLRARGLCYNCDEPIASIFCDTACQEDFERRQVINKRQGKQA